MGEGTGFGAILWQNFLKYDFIVFAVAGVTVYFLILTLKRSRTLFTLMNRVVYLPEAQSVAIVEGELRDVREYDVVVLRRGMLGSYSIFENLIMIFPLLGILGTVISLLPLVAQMSTAQIQLNFFGALTSTFWGLVFAIIFKTVDGWVAGQVQDNEAAVQLYLNRHGERDHVA